MTYKTDEQIARETRLKPISEVAESAGIPADGLELYGRYKERDYGKEGRQRLLLCAYQGH